MCKKLIKRMLTFVMCLLFTFTLFSFDSDKNIFSTKANAIDCFIASDSFTYYIKNVRSGKYLTLEGDSSTVGTQVIQYTYTGGYNQQWKFEYRSTGTYGGFYRIKSVKNTNRVIALENSSGNNGVLAKLADKADNVLQHFHIYEYGNNTVKFYTNASNNNKVLEINGASVYNNAKLIQYSPVDNRSDQWLIEPVNKITTNGTLYAERQNDKRIMTYPNFDRYNGTVNEKVLYQQVNYASQCMCAGGNHYNYNSGSAWYVNKQDFFQPTSFTLNDLNSHWSISQSWYDINSFMNKWNSSKHTYAYNQILIDSEWVCRAGDVIIVGTSSGTYFSPSFIGYVYSTSNDRDNTLIYAHTASGGTIMTLYQICLSYNCNHSSDSVIVYSVH